jgi:flagellar M-ring protein FliF
MDFLNKLFAQLNDLFKSMSPGARMTAGLLLVAVVVSLGYLFNSQAGGADTFLLNGQSFTSEEMTAMEAAFGKAGLSDYTVDGSRIRVVKSRQAAFLAAMADNGALPSQFGDHFSKALASSGPFTPRAQQEEMIKNARQRELAMVIRSMNGIENAVVHYDVQKRTGGLSNNQVITASVSVKPRGNLTLDEARVPMIRSLVASAIAGLSPENVTVVDINGRAHVGTKGGTGSAIDDPYLSMTRAYKDMIETDIRNTLAYVPGITATANVELDHKMVETIIATKVDPKPVPMSIETTEKSLTNTSTNGGGGGPSGLRAQQPNAPASLPGSGGGSQMEDTNATSKQHNVASHSNSETKLAGLTPKRVAVAIGVPSDYFEQVWQLQNPPADGADKKKPDAAALATIEAAEIKRIKEHVTQLIPKPVDPAQPIDPATLVTVTAFSRLAPPDLGGPSMVDRGLDWLAGSWSTLGMIGLGLFSLMMLKSFVGSVQISNPTPDVRSATVSEDDDEEQANAKGAAAATAGGEKDGGKSKQRTLHRRLGTGMSLREELIDMVREDPDAAANVLRSWIGNAT